MEQLLHACLGILTKDIQELSERRFYAVDAARRVFPIRHLGLCHPVELCGIDVNST